MKEERKKTYSWEVDTMEMEGNFKLAIKAKNFLDNPTKENLNEFKEELKNSSSLSMAAVISDLSRLVNSNQNVKECKELIKLIEPKFEESESKLEVYDPILGEFVSQDGNSKKAKM